jgi:hypothetical protein
VAQQLRVEGLGDGEDGVPHSEVKDNWQRTQAKVRRCFRSKTPDFPGTRQWGVGTDRGDAELGSVSIRG